MVDVWIMPIMAFIFSNILLEKKQKCWEHGNPKRHLLLKRSSLLKIYSELHLFIIPPLLIVLMFQWVRLVNFSQLLLIVLSFSNQYIYLDFECVQCKLETMSEEQLTSKKYLPLISEEFFKKFKCIFLKHHFSPHTHLPSLL